MLLPRVFTHVSQNPSSPERFLLIDRRPSFPAVPLQPPHSRTSAAMSDRWDDLNLCRPPPPYPRYFRRSFLEGHYEIFKTYSFSETSHALPLFLCPLPPMLLSALEDPLSAPRFSPSPPKMSGLYDIANLIVPLYDTSSPLPPPHGAFLIKSLSASYFPKRRAPADDRVFFSVRLPFSQEVPRFSSCNQGIFLRCRSFSSLSGHHPVYRVFLGIAFFPSPSRLLFPRRHKISGLFGEIFLELKARLPLVTSPLPRTHSS